MSEAGAELDIDWVAVADAGESSGTPVDRASVLELFGHYLTQADVAKSPAEDESSPGMLQLRYDKD